MATYEDELQNMTMAELTQEAHRVGLFVVQHMSTQELIEAIEQQRETNAIPEESFERPLGSSSSLPRGWENFPG